VTVSQVSDRSETSILEHNEVSQIMTVVFVNTQEPVLTYDEDLLVLTQTPCFDDVVYPAVPVRARLVVDKNPPV
jgi:hypothetical protein